jgi:hypothetical protein
LNVVASGYGTLSYQWYKNGNLLNAEISDILLLNNVDSTDAADYYVVITDDIEPGLTTQSATATVYTFPAWNGLQSYEPFDIAAGYSVGELPLQSPTVSGYSGPWVDIDFGNAEPALAAGSLVYSDPLYIGSSGDRIEKIADTGGVSAANSGRAYRMLEPALITTPSTTGVRYLSWLYRNGNENAAADAYVHSTLALYHSTGGAAPSGDAALRVFEAGISNSDFGTTNFGFRYMTTGAGNLGIAANSDVHLFVVKFDLTNVPGGDSMTVWLDPALGSGDPAGGTTTTGLDLDFESIAFSDYASNSSAWDEVRWGSTFNSVSLNTNPANTFATWISGYPGVGSLNGVGDDADHDGIPNGVENLFGTDPSLSSQGITGISRSGNTVTFQHPQNATPASNLTATLRWSTDLSTWNNDGAAQGGTTVTFTRIANTPAAGITSVSAIISGVVPAKFFADIKVSQTP